MAEIKMQRSPQPDVDGGELLMEMPSFRSISGGQEWPRLLLGYIHEVDDGGQPPEGEEEEEEEFEFASLSRDSLDELEPADADELFSDGSIRPVYPLFGRAFVLDEGDGKSPISKVRTGDDGGFGDNADAIRKLEESVGLCLSFRDFMTGNGGDLSTSSSSSSSSATRELSQELDGVPTESYCVWTPVSAPATPDLRKKSNSTGGSSATSKKWRLSNLVSRRSQSDGKERFVFVATPASSAAETAEKKDKTKAKPLPAATTAAGEQKKGKAAGRGGGRVVTEMDMATAHRLYYTKEGAAAGDRRRSFLPYRKDLFGFFAHVNAPGRGFHLF